MLTTRWRRLRDAGQGEEGLATVFAAVCVMVLMAVTGLVLQVGTALIARHRAESAADLAALAAAAQRLDGEDRACAQASALAAANRSVLTSCSADGSDMVVTVTVAVHLGPLGATATGRARAGPAAAVPRR